MKYLVVLLTLVSCVPPPCGYCSPPPCFCNNPNNIITTPGYHVPYNGYLPAYPDYDAIGQ